MPYKLQTGLPTDTNIIMMVKNIVITLEELKAQLGEEQVEKLIFNGLYHDIRYEHDGQEIGIPTLFLHPSSELRPLIPEWIFDAFVNAFV